VRLKEEQEGLETIEKIFVVDIDLKLKGTVTIGAVIGADKETLAQDLMETSVLTVSVYVDQEVCARLMEKYNLTVLPVVDQHQHMLGIITADDILKVLGDEATEDLFRLAGIGESKPFEQSALLGVYRRLPWLLVTLTGVSLLGAVISRFQGTIERIVALSFFIPAVMGLGGNTGIQASTVTLRGLVTNRIELKHFGWILKRELSIAALIGIVCSLGLGALAYVMFTLTIQPETEPSVSAYQFAIMVGFAILCSVTFSSLIGTSIPMLCHRLRIDPAIAAGPFVTTLIDIISQVIYFGIATWILMK
jgi:magnesium transporter